LNYFTFNESEFKNVAAQIAEFRILGSGSTVTPTPTYADCGRRCWRLAGGSTILPLNSK
jgi:hypothetical protein